MEREGGFDCNRYPKQAKTSTALTIHPGVNVATNADVDAPAAAAPPTINVNGAAVNVLKRNPQSPEECGVREQDRYLPITNVVRAMRRSLPTHVKISGEAKETIQECVSKYIGFITGEANERCHNEQRKTLTAEDVIWAMNKLGFDNYVEPLSLFLRRYRESEKKPPSARRGGCRAMDHAPVERGGGAGPVGPFAYNMAPPQAFRDPSMASFNSDSAGASSSQANVSENDPFAQFK